MGERLGKDDILTPSMVERIEAVLPVMQGPQFWMSLHDGLTSACATLRKQEAERAALLAVLSAGDVLMYALRRDGGDECRGSDIWDAADSLEIAMDKARALVGSGGEEA